MGIAMGPAVVGAVTVPVSTGPVPWGVAQVGRGERSLELAYIPDSCSSGSPQVTVAETLTAVTIDVQQSSFPAENCPSPLFAVAGVNVPLKAPLAGRRIVGTGEGFPASYDAPTEPSILASASGTQSMTAVPRLIGLAPANALQAVKISGLRTHFCAVGPRTGLPRVVSQRLAAGRVVHPGQLVRVRIAGAGVDAARCA
jgi:hypothetical protein